MAAPLVFLLAACGTDRLAASDASHDDRGPESTDARRDHANVDRPADAPPMNGDAGDPGGRIQHQAVDCMNTLYCPTDRCFQFEAFCRAQPCGEFTTYDCPIDCEIAVDCDGAEVCRYFMGGDPNCGG